MYGPLLSRFAIERGLSEAEAEEVVQDTAVGVARGLPGFRYEPSRCSFKTWMLNLARWRIGDALRRRRSDAARIEASGEAWDRGERWGAVGPSDIENVADPRATGLGDAWDAAWERRLTEVALDRVRRRVDPRSYQIFDLYVLKERPAREVADRIGVHVARVYLAKQRVGARVRRELRHLAKGGGLGEA